MPKSCDHDSREFADKLIEPMRDRAKELGYAIAVHGTLKRDIDLVAVPWGWQACDPQLLVEELKAVIEYVVGNISEFRAIDEMWDCPRNGKHFREGKRGYKYHGRRCWSFHLERRDGGPYVDLSVMPRMERTHEIVDGRVKYHHRILDWD